MPDHSNPPQEPSSAGAPQLRTWSKPTLVEEDYTITASVSSNSAHAHDGVGVLYS